MDKEDDDEIPAGMLRKSLLQNEELLSDVEQRVAADRGG